MNISTQQNFFFFSWIKMEETNKTLKVKCKNFQWMYFTKQTYHWVKSNSVITENFSYRDLLHLMETRHEVPIHLFLRQYSRDEQQLWKTPLKPIKIQIPQTINHDKPFQTLQKCFFEQTLWNLYVTSFLYRLQEKSRNMVAFSFNQQFTSIMIHMLLKHSSHHFLLNFTYFLILLTIFILFYSITLLEWFYSLLNT